MASLHSNRGAKRAREARAALGLDPQAPLRCVLAAVERVAPVVVAALPDDVAGACWRGGGQVVLWVNGTQPLVRQRFTVAHELGHVRCGHQRPAVDSVATVTGLAHDPYEVEANAFAAEFLVPRTAVEDRVRGRAPTLEDVVLLAAEHGVSTQVAHYRLVTAGLVGDERSAQLKRELDEGLAGDVWERLGCRALEDELATVERLPRLSPALAGSALAALVRGDVTAEAAAAAAGADAAVLGAATSAISG
jgi:hypothetical protein